MKKIILFLLALVSLSGCATTKVDRLDGDQVIDLSGRWNDTDSRLTAEAIVDDCLKRPWLENHVAREGQRPFVIVGTVRNRSSEHIDVMTFLKDIERELLNSGRVRLVASSGEREEIRTERGEQQSYATEETAKALAAETGADYMIQGTVTSITDAIGGQRVVRYQVSMELISLETTEKVWIGSHEIRKKVKQAKVGL